MEDAAGSWMAFAHTSPSKRETRVLEVNYVTR
jgi:hypothetical protein